MVNRGRQNFIFSGDGRGGFDQGRPFGSGDDSTIDVAAADMDADGFPSPGDITHPATQITAKPLSHVKVDVKNLNRRN